MGEIMNSRRIEMLVSALGAGLMAAALLAPGAFADTPAKGYEQFAGCPSPKENPNISLCLVNKIKGGHFQMGSKDVPITKTMTLSGGVTAKGELFPSPAGGLSKAKQKVPGGVIGLTGLTWLLEFFGSEALTLYATTELAGKPSNPFEDPLTLPIRVHLENGILGNNCYVGSFTNPIVLKLTTGTTSPPPPNKPISGHNPTSFEETENPFIARFKNAEFVDNSFSAPAASGCVLTLFGFIPINIDGLVNSQSGLPAAAGTNETKQEADIEFASPTSVYP
jgi:hypothetical protein